MEIGSGNFSSYGVQSILEFLVGYHASN
jgi:hypothetical protein